MEREIVITEDGPIEVIWRRGKKQTLQDMANFIYKLLLGKLQRGEIVITEDGKIKKIEEVNDETN